MKPKHFLYSGVLIAALMVAACGPEATPTALPPTDKPAPTATTEVPTPVPTKVEGPVPTKVEGPVPTKVEGPTTSATEGPVVSEGGVPMGFTEEGSPYRGNPDAPVTLLEYSEFQ